MVGTGDLTLYGVHPMTKKPRSSLSRRPRAGSQFFHDNYAFFPKLASETGNFSKAATDDNWDDVTSYKEKESISINDLESEFTLQTSSSEGSKDRQCNKKHKKFHDISKGISPKCNRTNSNRLSGSQFKRSREGVLAPANWKGSRQHKQDQFQLTEGGNKRARFGSAESDGNGRRYSGLAGDNDDGGVWGSSQETKLRKVKLKVGGITHTINTEMTSNSGGHRSISPGDPSARLLRSSNLLKQQQQLILQVQSNDKGRSSPDSENGSLCVPSVDLEGSVRKSKRVLKKRISDHDCDNDDTNADDGELQYLERLKLSKANVSAEYDVVHQAAENHKHKSLMVSKRRTACEFNELTGYEGRATSHKENHRKGRSRDADDLYSVDEEESAFSIEDDEAVGFNVSSRRKKPKKKPLHGATDGKDIPLRTRQRSLQSSSDPLYVAGLVRFPDDLPLAAPKKQKEQLTDVEQQLKKAEAAQRRRMQVEKAARESEAQAIRKILGQDANGKKREDKLRKRKEELAQEKAARALSLAANTVRWTMGPLGTVVSFPKDVGLPILFSSQACRYPAPRAKCAGPSCTNTYKYRDSKSNLPLCSLACYKAVNKVMEPVASC